MTIGMWIVCMFVALLVGRASKGSRIDDIARAQLRAPWLVRLRARVKHFLLPPHRERPQLPERPFMRERRQYEEALARLQEVCNEVAKEQAELVKEHGELISKYTHTRERPKPTSIPSDGIPCKR